MLALLSIAEALRMLGVALGIGLVIFVHELGHFLAARWCGVRVEVFSIGFGPSLLSWRRGSTHYQLAAVPLGGYVKMAGEEGRELGAPMADDELPSKTVGQRFLIYSGGVLMNMAFALLVFPILFAVGVPFLEPRVDPEPGGPAWQAGIEPGTAILAVNGHSVYDFVHIPTQVALADKSGVRLTLADPNGEGGEREVELKPEFNERYGFYTVGVRPALDPEQKLNVVPGGAAELAGIETGDRLVGVEGAPYGMRPAEALLQYAQGLERLPEGTPLRIEVEGASGRGWVEIHPAYDDSLGTPRLGVRPLQNLVAAVRPESPAMQSGLLTGDLLVALDKTRVYTALDLRSALFAEGGSKLLTFDRDEVRHQVGLGHMSIDERQEFLDGLALARNVASNAIGVTLGDPAAVAGLQDGDRIVAIDRTPSPAFEDLSALIRAAGSEGRSVALTVERTLDDGSVELLERIATPASGKIPLYGVFPAEARYVFQTDGPVEAVTVGVSSSWKLIQDSWLTLKGLLNREVSSDNVGGIISIGVISYQFAQSGLAKLFFFLCTLSVTLAFLNVLPIPILDGGHLFFLILEKLKGTPVSERVHGYSQLVGLVLILSLMVYVTFNDIVRHLF